MIKNTILYRRIWYVRKRNARKAGILLKLAIVAALFWLIASYLNGRIVPYVSGAVYEKADKVIEHALNSAVQKKFPRSITYNDIVSVNRTENGGIASIETDVALLNNLSAIFSEEVEMRLDSEDSYKIKAPLGAILGVLSRGGPYLIFDVYSGKTVNTEFISEFVPVGTGQTQHRIYLSVETDIYVSAALYSRKLRFSEKILLLESIINGKIPAKYQYGRY